MKSQLFRLFKQYKSRRIVNLNVNIFLALTFSAVVTSFILSLVEHLLVKTIFIIVVTIIVDSIFNILSFALLHQFANRLGKQQVIKDSLLIQVHRIFLSPLYYGVASIGQTLFLGIGLSLQLSIIFAYVLSTIIARIVHTIYCVRTGFFDTKQL